MFPIHHILPRLLASHPVIKFLDDRFSHDAIRNRMALPSTQRLATELSSSPHTGGHLGTYYEGFRTFLEQVKRSPRYNAAIAGDSRAQDELVSDLNGLVAAAKYALANGHLFANTPEGMTTEQANDENEKWFTNWRKYSEDYQAKIQQMQETVDQYDNAGQLDAALHLPLLSPTSGLSMAERIDILKRLRGGSPISLHFTPIGPVPGLPGLVPPFVDTRLPGFIPPSLLGLNQPEGFTPSNPLLTYGLPGFPAASADWEHLMKVPPSTAVPQEQQVLQFHSEIGQPLTYLSDQSQVLGPQTPPDQGSALLMGAGVLGSGAMMIPGAQGFGAALLAGLTAAALTRPAFAATSSGDTKVADGSVFSNGAAPYKPFDVGLPGLRSGKGRDESVGLSGSPGSDKRLLSPEWGRAATFADRFGNWSDTPAGTMPAQNAPGAPSTSPAAGAVATAEVRRLTRVNESNAGSVFTSGSAPVPYLPSTEFNERFGSWTVPTADGRSQQTSKPIGAFADEPSYLIPPPIFGVDGLGSNPHNDAEEWFSRWIRPLLGPE